MRAAAPIAKSLFTAAIVGLTATAWAAEANPPVAAPPAASATTPAAAPAPAAMPTAAGVTAAGAILGDIGIKQTIAFMVPSMMAELERNVTTTRPEIRDSLRETLRSIQPEFDKTAQRTFNEAATVLASQMSEKELQDVAAFFDGPAGKKYLAVQPAFLQKLSEIAEPWRQKLSTDILARAREEMKKKGVEF
jgi:uncharacterized protein